MLCYQAGIARPWEPPAYCNKESDATNILCSPATMPFGEVVRILAAENQHI
jgi:hypothetical protein